MRIQLKPLDQQIIVITGATSGHGLCSAEQAASAGAKVMLVARNEGARRAKCSDIQGQGGTADYVAADVGLEADVQRVATETIARFGGFDTWVNNAGIGIYTAVADLDLADHRKLFATNYWGVVGRCASSLQGASRRRDYQCRLNQ